eukprot:89124-Chlamydomonas_euryale.AAC.1
MLLPLVTRAQQILALAAHHSQSGQWEGPAHPPLTKRPMGGSCGSSPTPAPAPTYTHTLYTKARLDAIRVYMSASLPCTSCGAALMCLFRDALFIHRVEGHEMLA